MQVLERIEAGKKHKADSYEVLQFPYLITKCICLDSSCGCFRLDSSEKGTVVEGSEAMAVIRHQRCTDVREKAMVQNILL